MLLEGKKILIMGIRNKWSIAFGIAQSVYENGGKLIFTYRGESNKEKVKELVSEFKGSKIYALDDASDDEQVKSVFENIKESLKDKEELKVNLININKKSVENIKNIKFETIIIDSGLENLDKQTTIIEKLCQNAKYLVVNTDVNLIFNLSKYKKSDKNFLSF